MSTNNPTGGGPPPPGRSPYPPPPPPPPAASGGIGARPYAPVRPPARGGRDDNNNESNAAAASAPTTSPFLSSLLRFSPNNAGSMSGTATAPSTGGWSPVNIHHHLPSVAGSTAPRQSRARARFFESVVAQHPSATPRNSDNAENPNGRPPSFTTGAVNNGSRGATFLSPAETAKQNRPQQQASAMDGVPLDHLRQLARKALLQFPPEQAVFFASLVYSKTGSASDALLLAQTQLQAGKHTACLRVLEESSLLQLSTSAGAITTTTTELLMQQQPSSSNSSTTTTSTTVRQCWEAHLLACAALAARDEWTTLVELVEEACRIPNGNCGMGGRAAASQPLEDDDDLGWQTLVQSIPVEEQDTDDAQIHVLARLCWWRGQAYQNTGHTVRAARYWKRALSIDPYCQAAWEALLTRHLLTPLQAYDLLSGLDFGPQDEYLRALYMARIEVTPLEKPKPVVEEDSLDVGGGGVAGANASVALSDWHRAGPSLDASAIQLSSPIPTFGSPPSFTLHTAIGGGSVTAPSTIKKIRGTDAEDGPAPAAADPPEGEEIPPIEEDIDRAFSQLWSEHKLNRNPHVLAMAARRAYRRYEWRQALQYCQELDQMDPAMTEAAYCYLATLILLGHKRQLFRIAHEWVEASPKSAPAWFAVGAYYYSIQRYHVAQRHFCRATRLDPQCTEAWIAFGCSFAACDESDQALASFRAAQRLSPGEHCSLLYMGMEYVRTNHLVLAQYFLQAALNSSGGDPLCLHELGVLALQKGDFDAAIQWFHRALNALFGGAGTSIDDSLELCQDAYWEPTIFNLGHAYRKSRRFAQAARCFGRCKALCPQKFSTYSASGFTKHLMGDLAGAIEDYHQALGCKRDDPFATEMLNRALESFSEAAMLTENLTDNIPSTSTSSHQLMPAPFSSKKKPATTSFLSPGAESRGSRPPDSASSAMRMNESQDMETSEDMSSG